MQDGNPTITDMEPSTPDKELSQGRDTPNSSFERLLQTSLDVGQQTGVTVI
jgi:hypothetical protein